MKFSLLSSYSLTALISLSAMACAVESSDDMDDNTGAGGTSTGTGGTPGVPGTGGADASGGSTPGTGAAPSGTGGDAPAACAPVDPNNLLSDFENEEAKLVDVAGRSGSWYLSGDGSGTSTPTKIPDTPLAAEAGGACDSAFAFHTTGSGYTGWGALAAVDLVPKVSDVKQPYDGSSYSGLSFRAKSSSSVQIRVEIATADSMPEGGVCNPAAVSGDPDRCGDHFGLNVVVSPEWTDINIPFAQMAQKGWGLPAAGLDASQMYSVRFKVEGGDYDYWIDDVAFTK